MEFALAIWALGLDLFMRFALTLLLDRFEVTLDVTCLLAFTGGLEAVFGIESAGGW